MEIFTHLLVFFASVGLSVFSLLFTKPLNQAPLSKKETTFRACLSACMILLSVGVLFFFAREYFKTLLIGYALMAAGVLLGVVSSHKEKLKEIVVRQKALLVFLAILLAIVLLVKLLDAEYARGRARGIEYAKEELVKSAYESGYEAGKNDMLDEHSGDYDKGYEAGYESAVSDLEYEYAGKIEDTYDAAYEEGYDAGCEDSSGKAATPIYSSGYNENDIYRRAYEDAADQIRHEYDNEVADAYEQGYEEGYSDGKDGIIY